MTNKTIIELTNGNHIHYDDLLKKIATYIYVTVSNETTTNNYIIYVDEIENDLELPMGLIDQKMAKDIEEALFAEFTKQVAEVELTYEEGDDEHTEVDRFFDVTLYEDYCVGYVYDDQALVENRTI